MSKLDDLLEVHDKHDCFNCSTDDVDIPKQQIKDLMLEIVGPDVDIDEIRLSKVRAIKENRLEDVKHFDDAID